MKILISGASGYIGARIFKDLYGCYNVKGTFLKNRLFPELLQLDITDRKAVLETIFDIKPDLVVHAAAIPRRKLCENDPLKAIETNVNGTKNVLEAANANNARIIYISTLGAIEPITLYGKTKHLGEEIVKKAEIGYNILRLSVSFGYSPNTYNNRPFNRILKTLIEGKPIYYDNSWKFPPTYLGIVSDTILFLLKKKINNRTIAIAIPELKSKFEIASDILKPFGIDIKPKDEDVIERRIEKIPESNDKDFPNCSYQEMIQKIINEIKDNDLAKHKYQYR